MTVTGKLKKGKVDGDDVGSEDTETGARQEAMVEGMCWWMQRLCVYERQTEMDRQLLQVDPASQGPSGF